MTTFIAWVGADSRGTASINFSTDSRISWGSNGNPHWDMAQKTFASVFSADIFAYVNDVMFPSMVLGQIINAIDNGVLFDSDERLETRFYKVEEYIKNSHKLFPQQHRRSFCIFHAARIGTGLKSEFALNTISWSQATSSWKISRLIIPATSTIIAIDGTGKNAVSKWSARWNASSQGGTSRAIFSSFCNAIYSGEDKFTNGSPQIVSLYRKGFGRHIGFVDGGKRYLSGAELPISTIVNSSKIEWRNRYFERCDISGELIQEAKKHHVPKGLI
ncbi:hypothetical protein [Pectobacterium fontis]|uniref:Uncharacterized protein n=1 Tax=Pectobacterium fontis TaxID=2558042 RepID=A0A7V8L6A1_9GAMM|nr:hypothetical protein [Pectobacterium fontis]KHN51868.1 hypothetical protein OI69_09370 [Pectobacterium fontis]